MIWIQNKKWISWQFKSFLDQSISFENNDILPQFRYPPFDVINAIWDRISSFASMVQKNRKILRKKNKYFKISILEMLITQRGLDVSVV